MESKYNEMTLYSPSGFDGDIRADVHEISENVVCDRAKLFFNPPESPVFLVLFFQDDIGEEELEFLYNKLLGRGLISNIDPIAETKVDLEKGSLENSSFEIKWDGDFKTIFETAKEIFNDFNMPGGCERVRVCIRDVPSVNMKEWLMKRQREREGLDGQQSECESEV